MKNIRVIISSNLFSCDMIFTELKGLNFVKKMIKLYMKKLTNISYFDVEFKKVKL